MMGIKHVVTLAAVCLLATVSLGAAAQQRPSRLSDQQLKDLLSRIQTRTVTFHGSLEQAINHDQINGSQAEDRINQSVKDLEQASDRLRDRVNDRRSTTADVEEVLRRASSVDSFMADNRLDAAAQRDWQALRQDLDGLARAHGVAWNWTGSANGPARVDDKQVKQLLTRTKKDADQFRGSLDKALNRNRLDGSREEDPSISPSKTSPRRPTACARGSTAGRSSRATSRT